MYTDSHTHLYLDAFSDDRDKMIQRALDAGVTRMFLPNIDSSTIEPMFAMAKRLSRTMLSHDGSSSHLG